MKIALLNGSPKQKGSASGLLLEELAAFLPEEAELVRLPLHTARVEREVIETLCGCDALVFAFPLYVDGIPSHLLSCLCQLEQAGQGRPGATVWGIVNSGFYEGGQCGLALEALQNWAEKSRLRWGMGVGVGGGGSLAMMTSAPPGKGPKKAIGAAMEEMAGRITSAEEGPNRYVSVGLPRAVYHLCAEMGWRQMIRANGGRSRDLGKRE